MLERSTISNGFSLLEILIAMFILTLIITVVLEHQVFLLKVQADFEAREQAERAAQNSSLRSTLKQSSHYAERDLYASKVK